MIKNLREDFNKAVPMQVTGSMCIKQAMYVPIIGRPRSNALKVSTERGDVARLVFMWVFENLENFAA